MRVARCFDCAREEGLIGLRRQVDRRQQCVQSFGVAAAQGRGGYGCDDAFALAVGWVTAEHDQRVIEGGGVQALQVVHITLRRFLVRGAAVRRFE